MPGRKKKAVKDRPGWSGGRGRINGAEWLFALRPAQTRQVEDAAKT